MAEEQQPTSESSTIPSRVWVPILVIIAIIIGAVFVYEIWWKGSSNYNEPIPSATPRASTSPSPSQSTAPLSWNSALPDVKTLIADALPDCAKTGDSVSVIQQADVTGNGVPEALISTGCNGAYTTGEALFQFRNGKPMFAVFTDANSNVQSQSFVSGASVMNYADAKLLPSMKAVYQADGSAHPTTCTVSWKVTVFQWNAEKQIFVAAPQLASAVEAQDPQHFPKYFDPTAGPTTSPVPDCSTIQQEMNQGPFQPPSSSGSPSPTPSP